MAAIPAVCPAIASVGEPLGAAGLRSEAPGPLGSTPFVAFVTFALAMALFGVTALPADVHPKAVGVLVLAVASLSP